VILEILLTSLRYETNEDNLNFLLYLIYCFTYDDIKNTKGLLKITNDNIINTVRIIFYIYKKKNIFINNVKNNII